MGAAAGITVADGGRRAALSLRGGVVKVLARSPDEPDWVVERTVQADAALPAVVLDTGTIWAVAADATTLHVHAAQSKGPAARWELPSDDSGSFIVSIHSSSPGVVIVLSTCVVLWLEFAKDRQDVHVTRRVALPAVASQGNVSCATWSVRDELVFATAGPDISLRTVRFLNAPKTFTETKLVLSLASRTKASKPSVASLVAFGNHAVLLSVSGELQIFKRETRGAVYSLAFTRQFTPPETSHPLANLACMTGTSGPYFAVAFGEYLSFWDAIYGVGHQYSKLPVETDPGMVQLGFAIDIDLEPEDEVEGTLLAATKDGKSVRIRTKVPRLTLQLVTSDAEACQDILESDCCPPPPMGARPDLRKAIVTLASSGAVGPLQRILQEDDERDLGIFERLFQPSFEVADMSVDGLLGLDAPSDEKLVPSERVASAAAVRLLSEIDESPTIDTYSTLLIDLFSRGVLSWTALRATLLTSEELADKYEGALDIILESPFASVILPSYIVDVRDVPETELVRAVNAALSDDGKLIVALEPIVHRAQYDRRTLVGSMKTDMPIGNAARMLEWLSKRYHKLETRPGSKDHTTQLQHSYFPPGVSAKLRFRKEAREQHDSYATWMCVVLDAHFASLCMFPAARPCLEELQAMVRVERMVCNRVGPLASEANTLLLMRRVKDSSSNEFHKRKRTEGRKRSYSLARLELGF